MSRSGCRSRATFVAVLGLVAFCLTSVEPFGTILKFELAGPALAQRAPAASVPSKSKKSWRGPQSVAPVAERLIDAVVNISTTQVDRGPQGVPLPSVPKGAPFQEFFEDFFNKDGQGADQPRKVSSLGSGFVIDGKAGLIVTNNHVIADADEIIINFNDGTKLKVDKVLGSDPETDLALLKVTSKKPLADVAFGRSRIMRVGDWVMAIGNPFGLGGSVTVGIISAKQRDIKSSPYDEYLQTDAAINKGNSGGPLFNMDGEVIGINTAIISPTGGSIGIGFAVPSDTAVSIINQIAKYGEVHRSWLGVKIQTVNDEIAGSLGVPANMGALVSSVQSSSPAAKSGIKAGDVILVFNGEPVTRMRSLPRLVARAGVGKTVEVEIFRDGARKKMKVTLGRMLSDDARGRVSGGLKGDSKPGSAVKVLGLKIASLDDGLRAKYQLGAAVKGVVVVEIDAASEASKRSIKVGDVIVEAGQEPVLAPRDVEKSIEKIRRAGRSAVLLRIEGKKGELRFVAVPVQ